ncbi:flagellar protein [Salipaludibacillus agaradhaerens]|uniref:Flagellar protein FliT n=1 Tax=Salipaludibacillus agaradhaerens TaxID=76935 RepID=A0A9Q4AXY6_SALAG|nr:flagellar protein [Salipaludibacillus agaradhaerens]MCR6095076.1 flagellar protein [Salipaludibacillus agaradhaerens]MCR6115366.1 flagellar protein [Salipaludibacillus agaradhaerens]
MSIIHEVHRVTKELYDHLQQPLPSEEAREDYITKITESLEERKQLIKELRPPENDEEEKLKNEIFSMGEEVNNKLTAIQGIIRIDINKLKKRKDTGKKYESPYESKTVDGIFFDSKK